MFVQGWLEEIGYAGPEPGSQKVSGILKHRRFEVRGPFKHGIGELGPATKPMKDIEAGNSASAKSMGYPEPVGFSDGPMRSVWETRHRDREPSRMNRLPKRHRVCTPGTGEQSRLRDPGKLPYKPNEKIATYRH